MKTHRGRQEAGPSQQEEWKLLYFNLFLKSEIQQPSQCPNYAIFAEQDLSTCKVTD